MKHPTPLQLNAHALREIRQLSGPARGRAMLHYAAPVQKTALDRTLVIFDLALCAYAGWKIYRGFTHHPDSILPALLALPLTLLLADFIGQCFHKWLDSYASETHFLWGKAAQEFRKHHELPTNLNHVPYLDHVAAFGRLLCLPFLALSIGAWAHAWDASPAWGFHAALLLFLLLNATEIHKQAHRERPAPLARFLQATGLILDRRRHLKHHQPPFDSDFAVVNGWTHALTHRLDLWRRLDRFWWRGLGELPRIWVQDPRAIPDDVVAELLDYPERIPDDLVAYAEIYPERVPAPVAKAIARRGLVHPREWATLSDVSR